MSARPIAGDESAAKVSLAAAASMDAEFAAGRPGARDKKPGLVLTDLPRPVAMNKPHSHAAFNAPAIKLLPLTILLDPLAGSALSQIAELKEVEVVYGC